MNTAVVIHLAKATERLPLIDRVKTIFTQLEVYDAKDGSEWQANPQSQTAHPLTKKPVSQGNLGCTHSHIDLIHRALKAGDKSLIIIEDDCDFKPEVTTEIMMK